MTTRMAPPVTPQANYQKVLNLLLWYQYSTEDQFNPKHFAFVPIESILSFFFFWFFPFFFFLPFILVGEGRGLLASPHRSE